ncbi:amino acid permease [Anaerotignum sp.]
MSNNTEMKKELGMFTAMTTVVGCVIGSGVFFKPTAMYTATGGAPGLAIVAWIITSLMCLCAAMTFAEIAILMPETGGMPVYLKRVFGEKVGYLCGWMQTVVFYPGLVAALAVAVANQAKLFIGDGMVIPVAFACIIIMVALNCMGAKVGGVAQNIFTVAKLIPLVLIMIFGFIRGEGNPIFDPMLADGLSMGSVLGQLMIAVLFAFEGWTNVGAIAGEMKDPGKDLPKAIVGGVALIMAVYIIINLAYLWVLPADVMMNLESPASAVAMEIFGETGGKLVSIGIMISAGGACNGFILSGSRTALYMASQGDLPGSKALSKISGTGVPVNCIFLIGILGAIYALTGQFDLLTNLGTFVGWVFYTLTFAAVMVYRKQAPDVKRTYKVPAYPVIPLIAIISGLYVLINQLFMAGSASRMIAVGGIVLVLIGLPVRAIFAKKK